MNVMLTRRQTDIVDLVATGRTVKEVADVLDLSQQTIFNTLSLIYNRIKIPRNLSALAIWRVCTQHSIELPDFIRRAGATAFLILFTLTMNIDNEFTRLRRCRARVRRNEYEIVIEN